MAVTLPWLAYPLPMVYRFPGGLGASASKPKDAPLPAPPPTTVAMHMLRRLLRGEDLPL